MSIFFAFFLLVGNPGVSKSPTKAVLLSAFLPAGGQIYNEKYFKAAVLASIETYSGYKALDYYLGYRKSGDTEKFKSAVSFGFYFLGSWLYSMADAYVDAHLFDFGKKVQFTISSRGFGVRYNLRGGM